MNSQNKKEWFRKDNGGLIADTEFFEEKITTMRDVDMEKNPSNRPYKYSSMIRFEYREKECLSL